MRKYLRLLLSGVFLLFTCSLLAQDKTITGVIIADDDNTPLQDVTVSVKGTNNRTKTNEAGKFTVTAKPGQILQFTFVDYAKHEVMIGEGTTYNVRLVPSQKELGEVIVTTYGSKKVKEKSVTLHRKLKEKILLIHNVRILSTPYRVVLPVLLLHLQPAHQVHLPLSF